MLKNPVGYSIGMDNGTNMVKKRISRLVKQVKVVGIKNLFSSDFCISLSVIDTGKVLDMTAHLSETNNPKVPVV